jgi:glutamine amidotransferase
MIAIVDYGMGNLRSVQKAFEKIGAIARIVSFPRDIVHARGIVLPGVGAFGQAMDNLGAVGWVEPLRAACSQGVPFIGICLGMQLLFESSEEMGQHEGLGIFAGNVKRFPVGLKVPQMGWNQLNIVGAKHALSLLHDVPNGGYAYFVHSYYCAPSDSSVTLATTDYGVDFASIVGRDNVWGTQFHPEKSQGVVLKILTNFVELVKSKT